MKRFVIAGASFALLFFAAGLRLSYAAFGVSPPFLNATHLVPGSTYTQTIYLVQDNPVDATTINATLNVPDAIRPWITLDNGLQFTIPAGMQQFPVVVTVKIPEGQQLGSYSGNLLFATQPGKVGQVAIALGANVAINLTVGTGTYEQYSIPYITLPSIEEGWNPRVTLRFENDGNVPEQLDGATFDLYDEYDAVRLAYITQQTGFPVIPPFTSKEYTVEFPTDFHLGVGDYWGNVVFYKNNVAIASQKTIFHVLPRGSLSSPVDIVLQAVAGYWIYYLVAIVALLLVVRRIWVMRRRKKRI